MTIDNIKFVIDILKAVYFISFIFPSVLLYDIVIDINIIPNIGIIKRDINIYKIYMYVIYILHINIIYNNTIIYTSKKKIKLNSVLHHIKLCGCINNNF